MLVVSNKASKIWTITSLIVAVVALSFAPVLIRLSENELGPYGTIFNRFWIASIALNLANGIKILWGKINNHLLTTQKDVYTVKDFLYLFLGAGFNSACLVTWAWSLTKTTVANSNLLHNTTPIFATLGGWLLLGQSFNNRFLLGLALSMGGALMIGFEDFQLAQETLIGDGVALISALFYAGTFLVTEHLRAKFETTTILIWNCSLSSLFLLPCTLLFEERLLPVSRSGWFAVTILALFCTVIGVGALFYSLKQFSSGFVSMVMLIEPIIAAILAWAIFAEGLHLLNGLIFIVVLSGIYLAKSDKILEDVPDS
ncbi:MAG: DMT family transporter [Cyclobacteriaceae bacterium]